MNAHLFTERSSLASSRRARSSMNQMNSGGANDLLVATYGSLST
jgi:hypothetical protein